MTIIRWPERIRAKGELKLCPRASFKGSKWAADLDQGIKLMNGMLSDKSINLTFIKVDTENGAHITVETFAGAGMHGKTALETQGDGEKLRLDWARLKLPASPKINGDPKGVDVGAPLRMHILVHELVHCIGLTNDEHTDSNVFTKSLVITIGTNQPANGSASVPAIKLGPAVDLIRQAWDLPETK